MDDASGSVEVLLADHDPIARQAVRDAMAGRDEVRIVGEVADAGELTASARRLRPDVVLMCTDLPPEGAVATTLQLAQAAPDTRVVLFAVEEDVDSALAALGAGATGYLSKHIDMGSLARALHGAGMGEAAISRLMAARVLEMLRTFSARLGHMRPVRSPLSNRQWQVLDLLADGHSSAEIAQILGISADTVRGHRRQVMRGLGASSTADAVRAARGLRTGPLTR